MVTAPKAKEDLIMYLCASKEAIIAVLLTKKESKQMLIYFVSRAVQAPEINYNSMEKLILDLVHVSRRLRRYFQVPRSENKKAYVLIKIASTSFAHLTKQVLVDVLEEKSIEEKEILFVVEEEGYSWMTPLFEYLTDGTLPAEAKKVQAIKIKSRQYAIGFRRLQDDS
ncbi:reverse transcriptase domain-containing protein [Tanacetum coccineum]